VDKPDRYELEQGAAQGGTESGNTAVAQRPSIRGLAGKSWASLSDIDYNEAPDRAQHEGGRHHGGGAPTEYNRARRHGAGRALAI
jgi:hypothetical protein